MGNGGKMKSGIELLKRQVELKKQAINLFIDEIVDLEKAIDKLTQDKEYYSNEK